MRLNDWLRQRVTTAVGDRGRGQLRRVSHRVGMRPRINEAAAHSIQWPGEKAAAVVISADLELAWAWRYVRHAADPLAFAEARGHQGRRNLAHVLDLCDQYGLPVTWAVVGHLFLDHCARSPIQTHAELPRVEHFVNAYWRYQRGDWFDADPACADVGEKRWPAWYGPDLIQSIVARPTRHEIGCHSFSHVPFSDEQCPPEVANAELQVSQRLASQQDMVLRSFVFPGNLAGNYASLRDAGFQAYRWHGPYELDVPRRDRFGLWQIPGGVWLEKPYATWTVAEYARLLRSYVDIAIDRGLVCGLWFHPETDPENVQELMPRVFEYLDSRSSALWVTTMGGLTDWLVQCRLHQAYASCT
jgi:peptidoglycan/xylan/chitin deacetylase (PgdA/CDA1 family)